jgi:hypothetical protein
MKKFAAVAVIPLFAGFLCAQDRDRNSQTETTTTTTTWNGTLLDAGCRTTNTQHKETTSNENSTTNTETNRQTTECPVTTTTTTFGLLTPDGKYVQFDEAGNARIVEMVKNNKNWTTYVTEKKPVKVRVVGSKHGDVVVIKEIK